MGATERPAARGKRQGRTLRSDLGEELRIARLAAGLSQEAVATATGLPRSTVGRIERDEDTSVSIVEMATLLAVVGRRLIASSVPTGTAVRDAAHHRLLTALRERLPPGAAWRTEVPLPNPGDLRSWDAITRCGRLRVAIEAETRPRDGQELLRRLNQKRRDGGIDRLILLLLDSRSNRMFTREFAAELAADFPVGGAESMAALRQGRDPGDAVIMLGLSRLGLLAAQRPRTTRDRGPRGARTPAPTAGR